MPSAARVSIPALMFLMVACHSNSTSKVGSQTDSAPTDMASIRAASSGTPTITFVSEIGKVRQISYAENPKLYKVALVMYIGLGTTHPNWDIDGSVIEYLDGEAISYNANKSREENIRDCIGMFAQVARTDWKMDAGSLQILQDAWGEASAVVAGTDDPAVFTKYLNAARPSGLALDPQRLARTEEAMKIIQAKAVGRPPIDFSSKDGWRTHLEYMKNPKLYCAISRFLSTQQQIGADWNFTSAQATILPAFSHAGLDSPYCPYNSLPNIIAMETRIEYRDRPDAQRLLAECSNYIEGLAYAPRLYSGD
ncbi:MAG: hypothetical protein JST38_10470 [Bacteroidetes bacterium]|nr:hypothetical protein [Bacteroidota bacterium]